jgi:malonyl CoA-acyl carrier protein transacylase
VTAAPTSAPDADTFVDALTRHVTQPVRWQDSLEVLASQCPDATFVEVGPGEVLHNMLGRRWLPVRRAATDQRTADPTVRFRTTVEALRGRS